MIALLQRLWAPLRRGFFLTKIPSRLAADDKFLITAKSHNPITGPIMVTTSPRKSCPHSCPLKRHTESTRAGACYAEHGYLGAYIWTKLDRTAAGSTFQNGNIRVYGFEELLAAIRKLPGGSLWRHNQAGDLPSDDQRHIDRAKLRAITRANTGRRGFTFTHFNPFDFPANQKAIREANTNGFTVNLSGNSPAHADRLADLGIAPVTTVLPATVMTNTMTPKGRRIVICPARTHAGVTCATCGLCARQRKVIIGFPALGAGKAKIV